MTFIHTIANNLNKPEGDIIRLCEAKNIEVHYDQDGVWIYDDQAKALEEVEYQKPTRYNFRGPECTEIQKVFIGDGMQHFWIGNVIKYLYRASCVGDLKKAQVYLDMIIKDAEENGVKF